jgi:hypothetical protein
MLGSSVDINIIDPGQRNISRSPNNDPLKEACSIKSAGTTRPATPNINTHLNGCEITMRQLSWSAASATT